MLCNTKLKYLNLQTQMSNGKKTNYSNFHKNVLQFL